MNKQFLVAVLLMGLMAIQGCGGASKLTSQSTGASEETKAALSKLENQTFTYSAETALDENLPQASLQSLSLSLVRSSEVADETKKIQIDSYPAVTVTAVTGCLSLSDFNDRYFGAEFKMPNLKAVGDLDLLDEGYANSEDGASIEGKFDHFKVYVGNDYEESNQPFLNYDEFYYIEFYSGACEGDYFGSYREYIDIRIDQTNGNFTKKHGEKEVSKFQKSSTKISYYDESHYPHVRIDVDLSGENQTYKNLKWSYSNGAEFISGTDNNFKTSIVVSSDQIGINSFAFKVSASDSNSETRIFTGNFKLATDENTMIDHGQMIDMESMKYYMSDLYDEALLKVARILIDENEKIHIAYYDTNGNLGAYSPKL